MTDIALPPALQARIQPFAATDGMTVQDWALRCLEDLVGYAEQAAEEIDQSPEPRHVARERTKEDWSQTVELTITPQ